MQKTQFPAFMRPSRNIRRVSANSFEIDAYQRLAAIYLLRLALGMQKKNTAVYIIRFSGSN